MQHSDEMSREACSVTQRTCSRDSARTRGQPLEQDVYFGLVIGSAQGVMALTGACLGGSLPLVLRRLTIDPVLATAPLMTAIVDAFGFFPYPGLCPVDAPLVELNNAGRKRWAAEVL